MKIKSIKAGHITNCHFCKAEGNKVQAVWHLTVRCKQACHQHREVLEEMCRLDIRDAALEGYYTEADYQTWLKL